MENNYKKILTIAVYLETKGYSQPIAEFYDEEIYAQCSPYLEEIAQKLGGYITESLTTQDAEEKRLRGYGEEVA